MTTTKEHKLKMTGAQAARLAQLFSPQTEIEVEETNLKGTVSATADGSRQTSLVSRDGGRAILHEGGQITSDNVGNSESPTQAAMRRARESGGAPVIVERIR